MAMRLLKFHKFFCSTIPGSCIASNPPIGMDGILPDPALITPPLLSVAGEKFLPEHRRIPESTGWYSYADSNIYKLEYCDWHPRPMSLSLVVTSEVIPVPQFWLLYP